MSKDPKKLVLATRNAGKVRELRRLLASVPIELLSLSDFPDGPDVEETGSTYRANAELKAVAFAARTHHMVVADDSGLEIEALGNLPGVHSARFAGVDAGYDVKIPRLLSMLDETRDPERRGRFICVAAVADAAGKILFCAEGICEGRIAEAPRGDHGFGYDPIFVPDGFDQTFGELPDAIKEQISHRARAASLIVRYLLHFIDVST